MDFRIDTPPYSIYLFGCSLTNGPNLKHSMPLPFRVIHPSA